MSRFEGRIQFTREELIDELTNLVNECFNRSRDLDLPKDLREKLYEIGTALNLHLRDLTILELGVTTQEFKDAKASIEKISKQLEADLRKLKDIQRTFERIAELLSIAEDIAIIAAGYFT